ncbi:MAG: LamG domain-containing protein [Candidatus Nanosalina sp.]
MRKGQAMAISTLLIVALVTSVVSLYFSSVMPEMVETSEMQNMRELGNDFTGFRSDVSGVLKGAGTHWVGVQSSESIYLEKSDYRNDTGGNPGLVAWYEFNSGLGNDAVDSSIFSNTGTLNGANFVFPGYSGHALSFDGNDYVRVSDNSNTSLDVDTATVSAWVKTSASSSTDNVIVDKGKAYSLGAGTDGVSFTINGNWCAGACGSWLINDAGSIEAGEWVHVAGTWNGDKARAYINGRLVKKEDPSDSDIKNTDKDLGIGARKVDSSPKAFFEGGIDQLRIYNRSLSESEVEELYHKFDPPGLDVSRSFDLGSETVPFLGSLHSSGVLQIEGGSKPFVSVFDITSGSCTQSDPPKLLNVSTGHMSVSIDNNYYPDQSYTFGSGAVIFEQSQNRYFVRDPFVSVLDNGGSKRVELDLVDISGQDGVSGSVTVNVNADLRRYFEERYEFGTENAFQFTVERPQLWTRYFNRTVEDQGLGQVERIGEGVRVCFNQTSYGLQYGRFKLSTN